VKKMAHNDADTFARLWAWLHNMPWQPRTLRSKTSDIKSACFAWCFSMIVATLPFCACRYSGLLGSSIGSDAYHLFDTDTNHIADIGNMGHFKCDLYSKWTCFCNMMCMTVNIIWYNLNSLSFFPGPPDSCTKWYPAADRQWLCLARSSFQWGED